MSWTYNDNTYVVLKRCQWWSIMDEEKIDISEGDEIGSFAANNIIIRNQSELDVVQELDGNEYIQAMINLGYIKLKE